MRSKNKVRLAIILGIVFGILLIMIPLFLAIFDKISWLAFALIIFLFITLVGATFLGIKLRKSSKEPDKIISEIEPKEALEILEDKLIEEYADHFMIEGQTTVNEGGANVEKTPILWVWGKGFHGGKWINMMMSLNTKRIAIVIGGDATEIKEALRALAENPKIEETLEPIVRIDPFTGEKVTGTRIKRQTVQQRKKEEEEKEQDEREAY